MSLTFPLLLVVLIITSIINPTFIKAQTSIAAAVSVAADDETDWPNSSEIADLLHTETVIMENLRSYINALDNKITIIKTKTQEIRGIYDVALNDTAGKYFGHPINTFHLIKRMSHDWETLRTFARRDVTGHIVANITRFSEILAFPNAEDLDVVLDKILRAEDVYQHVKMDGEFNGLMDLRTQMRWNDCLMVGQHSYKKKEYHLARTWLEAALRKIIPSSDTIKANAKILQTMAIVEYKSGNLTEALRLTKDVLQMNPRNANVISMQEKILRKMENKSNEL